MALAQLPIIGAVEALDGAITLESAVLLKALPGIFSGCVVGDSADMAVDEVCRARAAFDGVGQDVALPALSVCHELRGKTNVDAGPIYVGGLSDDGHKLTARI